MKNKLSNVLLLLIFLAGLSLLLYPTVSDAYNSYLQSRIILQYADQVDQMESDVYQQTLEAAQAYNAKLLERSNPYQLPQELEEIYWQLLDTTGNGVMAYVEIPSIEVTLPIAHGTEEQTLQSYVGHLEWSSLPVGGKGTHCVISGHRGLPSSELFTNIDHLELGDLFYVHVLGQTLEYMVDNITVVLPHEYESLRIQQDQDYVTLLTCTPYGINSHRLLVRGTRLDRSAPGANASLLVKNEIQSLDLMVVIPLILVALSVVAFIILAMDTGKKKPKKKGDRTHGKK